MYILIHMHMHMHMHLHTLTHTFHEIWWKGVTMAKDEHIQFKSGPRQMGDFNYLFFN